MPSPTITNLVFQGGSVKGIAYVGALEVLEETLDMKQIKRVAGTSAGSITAALLAVGCNTAQIRELLLEFDFKEILDDCAGGVSTQPKVLKSVEKQEQDKPTFFSKIPAKTAKIPLAYRLLSHNGVYEGEYIRTWVEKILFEQVSFLTNGEYDGTNLTFLELHELTEKFPGVFRDLFVVGSNLTRGVQTVFSYDNPETQHVIIADAIRISMSIPALFKPHHVYFKIDGQRLIDTRRDEWVDGGLYENYPIDCFDDLKYMEPGESLVVEDRRLYNPQTLGFRLVGKDRKDYCEGISTQPPQNASSSVTSFFSAIVNARKAQQEQKYSQAENVERTVYIDHSGISTLAFNISEENQRALIDSGRQATELYLSKFDDLVLTPTSTETHGSSI